MIVDFFEGTAELIDLTCLEVYMVSRYLRANGLECLYPDFTNIEIDGPTLLTDFIKKTSLHKMSVNIVMSIHKTHDFMEFNKWYDENNDASLDELLNKIEKEGWK